jgi:hypothetical protein
VRLAKPDPARHYWLLLLLFAAIRQPAVAYLAQKRWILGDAVPPATAAMLAVTGC